jgi:uncharacterized membrane protein YraQ (UPF0718 family)
MSSLLPNAWPDPVRRLRWLRTQLPFVVVVAIILASAVYLYVEPDHWRRGTSALAFGVVVAGLFRLLLPAHAAGLLAVRKNRFFDTLCYLAMGGVIIAVDIRLH